jgi:hypothetical protein
MNLDKINPQELVDRAILIKNKINHAIKKRDIHRVSLLLNKLVKHNVLYNEITANGYMDFDTDLWLVVDINSLVNKIISVFGEQGYEIVNKLISRRLQTMINQSYILNDIRRGVIKNDDFEDDFYSYLKEPIMEYALDIVDNLSIAISQRDQSTAQRLFHDLEKYIRVNNKDISDFILDKIDLGNIEKAIDNVFGTGNGDDDDDDEDDEDDEDENFSDDSDNKDELIGISSNAIVLDISTRLYDALCNQDRNTVHALLEELVNFILSSNNNHLWFVVDITRIINNIYAVFGKNREKLYINTLISPELQYDIHKAYSSYEDEEDVDEWKVLQTKRKRR